MEAPLDRPDASDARLPRGENTSDDAPGGQSWACFWIAALAIAAIVVHVVLRYAVAASPERRAAPLWVALVFGGGPLLVELGGKLWRRELGSDLLAGISILASMALGEHLAGTLVVLMLAGGEALEGYAVRRASSVLHALARRLPSAAHRQRNAHMEDIPLAAVAVDDVLVIFPHEACPVDGVVVDGHGVMDESYLTGEPYLMSKSPGAAVLSGAMNGEAALVIRATRRAVDSRYAQIMQVVRDTEQRRPRMRRLADRLGAWYTPLTLGIALVAGVLAGDPRRFLAVLVVATPCPLLIGIPVAILGAISLAARRGIVIRDPAVLEQIEECRTVIFDKTGTLTYGEPRLTEQLCDGEFEPANVLALAASTERYSKHPLAGAVVAAARQAGVALREASQVAERPGEGLSARVGPHEVRITHRGKLLREQPECAGRLPPTAGGLECVVLVDGRYAATYRFRDEPRGDGAPFIEHLRPRHHVDRVLLVSGDRESEVRYLAERVGIGEVHFAQSPEDKVTRVRAETARQKTLFLGDGINDAPALAAATVGVAFGQLSDVTSGAAGAVIMDTSLERFDELLHIGRRMRRIALQSAVGGMALSLAGMVLAAAGLLPPVAGAIAQECIDVLAVLNALRAGAPPRTLSDY